MLKELRKEFSKLIGKEEVTMEQTPVNPQAGVVEDTTAQFDAQAIAAQGEALTAALAEVQELKSQLEAAVAAKNALLEQITNDKNKARMSVISKAVGDQKAQAVFEATKALGDAEFQAIVSAMAGTYEAESKTELFNEVGAAAEANVDKVTEDGSREMQILQAKYKKQ